MNLDKLQDYLAIDEPDSTDSAALMIGKPQPGKAPVENRVRENPVEQDRNGSANSKYYSASVLERLQEIELAQKLGYLLCHCTWPPQIMVLSTADFIYRCQRCARVRDL